MRFKWHRLIPPVGHIHKTRYNWGYDYKKLRFQRVYNIPMVGKRKKRCQPYTREPIAKMLKYNPEKHIPLLLKTFKELGFVEHFCNKADIVPCTFYEWVKTFPEFKEAYDKAVFYAKSEWEHLPLVNPNINIAYWTAIMRNRFRYYTRLPNLKGKSIKEKLEAYEEAVGTGEIPIEKYCNLVGKLSDEVKAKEASKDDITPNALTPAQQDEEAQALIDFFVSQGYKTSEAATMLIKFSEGSKFLSERKNKNVS